MTSRAKVTVRTTNEGKERLCAKCKEWWPADGEFFHRTGGDVLHCWCKACVIETKLAKRQAASVGIVAP